MILTYVIIFYRRVGYKFIYCTLNIIFTYYWGPTDFQSILISCIPMFVQRTLTLQLFGRFSHWEIVPLFCWYEMFFGRNVTAFYSTIIVLLWSRAKKRNTVNTMEKNDKEKERNKEGMDQPNILILVVKLLFVCIFPTLTIKGLKNLLLETKDCSIDF